MLPLEEQVFTKVWVPTLTSFTDWVLREAIKQDIGRIFFLARDAYYPYLIAKYLKEKKQLTIDVRYLEGSRFAWRMAEFGMEDSDPIARICIGGVHVTLRSILRRGGLDNSEILEIGRILQKEQELDRTLTYEETVNYQKELRACEPLLVLIRRKGREALEKTRRYFKQEGLCDDISVAICDSGWVGSLQKTLKNITGKRIEGYYFGLYELPRYVDKGTYHTFYFRPYADIRRKARFSNCLFECVCSSEKGMTLGYKEANGILMPIYESEKNQNAKRLREQEELLIRELKHLAWVPALSPEEVEKLISRFMSEPTREESEVYGKWMFSDDVVNNSFQTLSIELTEEERRNLNPMRRLFIMKGLNKGKLKDSAWPEGSVLLSTSSPKKGLTDIRNYKRWVYLRKSFRRNR